MAFKRFSLRGFSSDFTTRRQIEGYQSTYICWATIYQGKHIRRKLDRMSAMIPTAEGYRMAQRLSEELQAELIGRHGLKPVGAELSSSKEIR